MFLPEVLRELMSKSKNEHIKHSESQDCFLKCMKQKSDKEGNQREGYMGSTKAPGSSSQRSKSV